MSTMSSSDLENRLEILVDLTHYTIKQIWPGAVLWGAGKALQSKIKLMKKRYTETIPILFWVNSNVTCVHVRGRWSVQQVMKELRKRQILPSEDQARISAIITAHGKAVQPNSREAIRDFCKYANNGDIFRIYLQGQTNNMTPTTYMRMIKKLRTKSVLFYIFLEMAHISLPTKNYLNQNDEFNAIYFDCLKDFIETFQQASFPGLDICSIFRFLLGADNIEILIHNMSQNAILVRSINIQSREEFSLSQSLRPQVSRDIALIREDLDILQDYSDRAMWSKTNRIILHGQINALVDKMESFLFAEIF